MNSKSSLKKIFRIFVHSPFYIKEDLHGILPQMWNSYVPR
jgi:hypothetical protein